MKLVDLYYGTVGFVKDFSEIVGIACVPAIAGYVSVQRVRVLWVDWSPSIRSRFRGLFVDVFCAAVVNEFCMWCL